MKVDSCSSIRFWHLNKAICSLFCNIFENYFRVILHKQKRKKSLREQTNNQNFFKPIRKLLFPCPQSSPPISMHLFFQQVKSVYFGNVTILITIRKALIFYNIQSNSTSMESSYNDQSSCSSDSQAPLKKHSESNQEGKWAVGQWTQQEKIRYISYIFFNKDSLSSKLIRRTSKIFKQMSRFIQTRSPAQCRSQNQKVHRRFKTINRIVTSFKIEIGAERFEAAYEEISKHPLIKFHTEFEHKSSSQVEAERQARKETREMSVQTGSDGVMVEMTAQEYMEWRVFKAMKCYNASCIPLLNTVGIFQP